MFSRLFDALRGRGVRAQAPAVSSAASPVSSPASSSASSSSSRPDLPLDRLRAQLEQGEAVAACTELHALANRHPDDPDVLSLYGWALFDVSAIEQARPVLAAALSLRPDHPEALNTMGAMAAELDDPLDAVGWFEDALDAAPGNPAAQYNLSQVLFLAGQYRRGFDLLRARRPLFFGRSNPLDPLPMWQGESLEGKHVFVWCDWGGLGDHLQFIRYIPLLAQRAKPARISLGSSEAFEQLFQRVEGAAGWVRPGHPPYADLHCPLLDLPYHFSTDLDNVPAHTPYLSADAGEAAQWGSQLEAAGLGRDQLRVGLAWKSTGPDHEAPIYKRMRLSKSLPEPLLAALNAAKARFVSVQVGASGYETAATGLRLFDCSGGLRSFSDTAAVIENLDLVISADTSVAHLAAAMGKPVLLLLRKESGMFWLHGRNDSPWYPNMRILRQGTSGDWAPVIGQAAHWLDVAAREGARAIIPAGPGA